MVPSFVITVAADGECFLRDGFSLVETICFGSFEFIAGCFDGLNLSPWRHGLNPVTPRSEIMEMKPPYVCPGCLTHTYNNNMIN
jgi:hypothetical protein